jgi:hypothetical protein
MIIEVADIDLAMSIDVVFSLRLAAIPEDFHSTL